ncbi:MAG: restriction endonuclease subunit S [Oscillospiraceae bacterium]|nr:restriction endonuclease subunit S [Oscillospiraceae bacterium]
MKRYAEYKDSGVEWIGEIPVDWDRTKLKNLLATPITDGPHETPEILDEGIPFLSAEAVKNLKLNFDLKRGYISQNEHERFCLKCKPQRGDIFMIKSGATTGNIAMVETDEEFSVWSPLALIRCNENKIDRYYMFLFLQSFIFRRQVKLFWSYGTQQNIGMGVLGNLFVAYPDVETQRRIADYLDRRTSAIDTLIADKLRLIDLLREKRQSLISEAVTKGLDPTAAMRDSGVEWIGEIPMGWEVKRLKFAVFLRNIKSADMSLQYIGLENVESATGALQYNEAAETEEDMKQANLFYTNDVMFGKLRPYLRKAFVAEFNGQCSGELLVFEPKIYTSKYLLYMVLSHGFINWVDSSTYGSKMPRASWDFIGNMETPVPTPQEQQQIADYLDTKTAAIDTLISDITTQIDKLKEYRQSVISEAVTGKVEV